MASVCERSESERPRLKAVRVFSAKVAALN